MYNAFSINKLNALKDKVVLFTIYSSVLKSTDNSEK